MHSEISLLLWCLPRVYTPHLPEALRWFIKWHLLKNGASGNGSRAGLPGCRRWIDGQHLGAQLPFRLWAAVSEEAHLNSRSFHPFDNKGRQPHAFWEPLSRNLERATVRSMGPGVRHSVRAPRAVSVQCCSESGMPRRQMRLLWPSTKVHTHRCSWGMNESSSVFSENLALWLYKLAQD